MLTLRASLAPGTFGFIGRVNAIPGVTVPDETIDGFPEFAFSMDTIRDPLVKDKLRKIARQIVASHQGARRIIGFEVHGHADQTVRIAAGAERDRAELEVSRDRAEHCRDLLFQLIEEEGGKPIIQGIKANSAARGFGSAHRVFKPATTEPQMRKNRRVEIFLKLFESPPPRPSPPSPPPKPEVRNKYRIQIKSGLTVVFGTPTLFSLATGLTTRTTLHVVITDVDRKQQAKFDITSTGKTLPPLNPTGAQLLSTIIIAEGAPSDFNAIDGTTLFSFNGDCLAGQNSSIAGIGVGGNFVVFFESLRGPTRPNPVLVKGGTVPGLPLLVVGILPLSGSIKMVGSPAGS